MIICVSGTPGTGKTTLAKELAKGIKAEYVDVKKLVKEKHLADSYDKEKKCDVVDVKKLNKVLIEIIKKAKKSNSSLVIDSHLSHFLPRSYVDFCIITTCELKKLKKRLEKKGYGSQKVRENLDCEIFGICLNEAEKAGHDIIEADTTKNYVLKEILKKISHF